MMICPFVFSWFIDQWNSIWSQLEVSFPDVDLIQTDDGIKVCVESVCRLRIRTWRLVSVSWFDSFWTTTKTWSPCWRRDSRSLANTCRYHCCQECQYSGMFSVLIFTVDASSSLTKFHMSLCMIFFFVGYQLAAEPGCISLLCTNLLYRPDKKQPFPIMSKADEKEELPLNSDLHWPLCKHRSGWCRAD